MRKTLPENIEAGRLTEGEFATNRGWGPTGFFQVIGPTGAMLTIVGSEGYAEIPWEHVSVSTRHRCPNWVEMCWIKDAFFEETECVVQYHPPKADWVNNHPYCLHMWRSTAVEFPRPPSIAVGVKSEGILTPERAAQLRREM